jgi:hypothetical protein
MGWTEDGVLDATVPSYAMLCITSYKHIQSYLSKAVPELSKAQRASRASGGPSNSEPQHAGQLLVGSQHWHITNLSYLGQV